MRTILSERSPRIDAMAPARLEVALFSMGCFKSSEARLGITRGVWHTCVGYAGGAFPSPTYDDVGDHTEAVMAEYDPGAISYGQLLELFMYWYCASPLETSPRRAPRIFVRDVKERRLAQAAIERNALCGKDYPRAHIVPFKTFYRAEPRLQKHHLRREPWLFEELLALYGTEEDLLRSTSAARLNGLLGQAPAPALRSLPESIDLYGLSPEAVLTLQHLGDQATYP